MSDTISSVVIAIAALLSLVLTSLAGRSYMRSKDPRMVFLTGAFGIFFLKNLMFLYEVRTLSFGHETTEMLGSIFDVATLILLITPILKRP